MSTWRNPDYRWWLVGDSATALGLSVRSFALPLVAYGLTGSTARAGLVLTLAITLSVLATPLGGVLIDRHDRRLMIRCHALSGTLTWGAVAALLATGQLTYPLLMALACLGAVGAGLFGYATDAALRSIVSATEYPSAMAVNQGRDAGVHLVAGPLGGVLYAVRAWSPFAVAVVGHAVAGLASLGIQADLRPPARERRGVLADLREAGTWVAGRRRVRALALPLLLVNFGANGLVIGFQLTLLQRGHPPVEIGWVSAAVAVSSLVGAVVAGRLVQRVATGHLAAAALTWFTLCLVPTLGWNDYPGLLGALAAGFVLVPALNASLLGYLFALAPVELQGRLQALLTLLVGALTALAPVVAGATLASGGFGAMTVTFLTACVAAVALIWASEPIRSIPRPDRWQDAPL